MTDVTKDWAGGEPLRETGDPTAPAPMTTDLTPDSGDRTPPAATAAGESRSFKDTRKSSPKPPGDTAPNRTGGTSYAGVQAVTEDETLLRASLETIRAKAEELRGQARGWAEVSRAQALQAIDERPVTAVATAFGVGLVVGALLSR